jgi:hypothetical protein
MPAGHATARTERLSKPLTSLTWIVQAAGGALALRLAARVPVLVQPRVDDQPAADEREHAEAGSSQLDRAGAESAADPHDAEHRDERQQQDPAPADVTGIRRARR